ncbi:MAG: PH domain-containing protein [Thermoanaerobaculia bacterium]
MSYVDSNLMPGEEVVFRPRYHPVRFLPALSGLVAGIAVAVCGGIFKDTPALRSSPMLLYVGLGIVGLALLGMAWRAFSDSFDEFAVTNHRVIRKTGFLKRSVRQIPLDRVQDLNVHSTLGGRWFSYGDVELQTAGADGTVVFPRIQHPEEFRNVLFVHRGTASEPVRFAGPAPSVSAARPSVESRLKDLDALHKQGLLSEEEYQEKRKSLIHEL